MCSWVAHLYYLVHYHVAVHVLLFMWSQWCKFIIACSRHGAGLKFVLVEKLFFHCECSVSALWVHCECNVSALWVHSQCSVKHLLKPYCWMNKLTTEQLDYFPWTVTTNLQTVKEQASKFCRESTAWKNCARINCCLSWACFCHRSSNG